MLAVVICHAGWHVQRRLNDGFQGLGQTFLILAFLGLLGKLDVDRQSALNADMKNSLRDGGSIADSIAGAGPVALGTVFSWPTGKCQETGVFQTMSFSRRIFGEQRN